MLLGLISDTHDNVAATKAAVEILRGRGVEVVLHAGDLVEAEMLEHLAAMLPTPVHFVFGNNEFDLAAVRSKALAVGVMCHGNFADLTFGGKRIALLHGHEGALMQRVIRSGDFDYVVHGHTHQQRDQRVGRTRVINPGAVQRANPRSVAVLDTSTDGVAFLEIPR